MRYFQALHQDGTLEEYCAYEVEEFPFQNVSRETLNSIYSKKIKYLNEYMTFDIETTTYLNENYIPPRPYGFMYHWQACFGGYCVYGRRWEEWINFMQMCKKISLETLSVIVIYVHNLGFEFQFIRQILKQFGEEVEVFAPQKRKPLTIRIDKTFEFRCSWKLSNMSLYMFTKNEYGNIYLKADGDLDYKKYRTYLTVLTNTEFSYCMMDVLALYTAIKAKMRNENDDITSIPLTSTSYVRRDCRRHCKADKTYKSLYLKQRLTCPIYLLLKEAGRGGDTGANRYLAGQIISDVDSYDVKSSYPYQLVTQEFPCTRFYLYGNEFTISEFNGLCSKKAVLFRAFFSKIRIKKEVVDIYLPYSKAIEKPENAVIANGRLLSADSAFYTLTELDWIIVQESYEWDEISISDVYTAKKALLPRPIRNTVMEYFETKCKLDLLADQQKTAGQLEEFANTKYLYMRSKNRLNGIFGMCYTDPVRDGITCNLDTGEWTQSKPCIDDALNEFYSNGNNFLVYAWGVWTTAHARLHLHKLTKIVGQNTIYWDTDSNKGISSNAIKWQVMLANRAIKRNCIETGAWTKVQGHLYYLGIYEYEAHYKEFKTLGAKKYAYIDDEGKLSCTISGVAKSNSPNHPDGARELKTIENLQAGFVFREAGGITLYYNDDIEFGYHEINGLRMLTGSNVGMVDSEYTIGITKEYAEIIGYNEYCIDK